MVVFLSGNGVARNDEVAVHHRRKTRSPKNKKTLKCKKRQNKNTFVIVA